MPVLGGIHYTCLTWSHTTSRALISLKLLGLIPETTLEKKFKNRSVSKQEWFNASIKPEGDSLD